MKTVAGRLIIAVLLFAAAAAFVSEARRARQAAESRERLATLQYARSSFSLDEGEEAPAMVPLPFGALADERLRQQAIASYWRVEYDTLTDPDGLIGRSGDLAAADAQLLFVAANASFRSAQARPGGDRAAAVERLDRVVDAYADVLRADPANTDAAYNYEYVSRFRDRLARNAKPARPREGRPPLIPSPDLPTGPTIHGFPGGPPEEIPGSDFRTLAPMPYDEREETDPGQGPAPRRRG